MTDSLGPSEMEALLALLDNASRNGSGLCHQAAAAIRQLWAERDEAQAELKEHGYYECVPKKDLRAAEVALAEAEGKIARLRATLDDIASGELGINVAIRAAKRVLAATAPQEPTP